MYLDKKHYLCKLEVTINTMTRQLYTTILAALILCVACHKEEPQRTGDSHIMFTAESHAFGVVTSDEWFEIPISVSRSVEHNRTIGVEVVAAESSAIEGRDFEVESHTLTIKGGSSGTALRIRGIAEAFDHNSTKEITLRLVLDEESISNSESIETKVVLRHCCPFDISNFEGYAVLTSTWCMQYMNSDSRLVRTHVEDGNVVVIEDMLYEGYDIRIKVNSDDRLNPIAALCGVQVLGSTGEAFGTIYGDGKLLICEASDYESTSADLSGYLSFYSLCENFMMLYTVMYVEGVGEVGLFGNIIEWISDDEAERIMREGL